MFASTFSKFFLAVLTILALLLSASSALVAPISVRDTTINTTTALNTTDHSASGLTRFALKCIAGYDGMQCHNAYGTHCSVFGTVEDQGPYDFIFPIHGCTIMARICFCAFIWTANPADSGCFGCYGKRDGGVEEINEGLEVVARELESLDIDMRNTSNIDAKIATLSLTWELSCNPDLYTPQQCFQTYGTTCSSLGVMENTAPVGSEHGCTTSNSSCACVAIPAAHSSFLDDISDFGDFAETI